MVKRPQRRNDFDLDLSTRDGRREYHRLQMRMERLQDDLRRQSIPYKKKLLDWLLQEI